MKLITALVFALSVVIVFAGRHHAHSGRPHTSKLYAAPNATEEETNIAIIQDYYQLLFQNKNLSAIDLYIDQGYIQHNPWLADGPDALKEMALKGPWELEIKRVAATGDLVFVHAWADADFLTEQLGGTKGMAIVDIYRMKDGKIMEHWDSIMSVPDESANNNTMF